MCNAINSSNLETSKTPPEDICILTRDADLAVLGLLFSVVMYFTKGKSFLQYVGWGDLPISHEHDKKSTPKCSSGHVECNFDNAAEFFLLKVRTIFAWSRSKIYKSSE